MVLVWLCKQSIFRNIHKKKVIQSLYTVLVDDTLRNLEFHPNEIEEVMAGSDVWQFCFEM